MRKRPILFVLILALIMSIAGCSSTTDKSGNMNSLTDVLYPETVGFEDIDARREVRQQNRVEDNFRAALSGFSYETASALLSGAEGNANYSPLSLYFALALAGTGAKGETQSQIFDLLGISGSDELSTQCGNLYRLLYTDNEITRLEIANSLWMDNNRVFNDSFVQNAAENFYASSFPVDFSDETTGNAMGQWVSDHTNGTLSPDFQTSAEQILSIINTVYFCDEWNYCFTKDKTAEDVFHAPQGDVTVDFMNQTAGSDFVKGDGFTRSALGLKGSGQMIFILPDEGMDVSDLLSSAGSVQALFESGESCYAEVVWQVPKLSFDSQYELVDALKTLGMTEAFKYNADFSGITDGTAFISDVIQQTHIAVDENGVEASAFTAMILLGSAGPDGRAEMILNRPFIYGITAANGALLFVGVCSNPAA